MWNNVVLNLEMDKYMHITSTLSNCLSLSRREQTLIELTVAQEKQIENLPKSSKALIAQENQLVQALANENMALKETKQASQNTLNEIKLLKKAKKNQKEEHIKALFERSNNLRKKQKQLLEKVDFLDTVKKEFDKIRPELGDYLGLPRPNLLDELHALTPPKD